MNAKWIYLAYAKSSTILQYMYIALLKRQKAQTTHRSCHSRKAKAKPSWPRPKNGLKAKA